MNAGQRRQLNNVVLPVHDVVAEFTPRIIEPSKEKQKALGVADYTLLFRVGAYRVLTLFPVDRDTWSFKEFDSESGELVLLHDETTKVPESDVASRVLSATITSIQDQLASYRDNGFPSPAHAESAAVIARQLAVLQQRAITRDGRVTVSVVADEDDDYFG